MPYLQAFSTSTGRSSDEKRKNSTKAEITLRAGKLLVAALAESIATPGRNLLRQIHLLSPLMHHTVAKSSTSCHPATYESSTTSPSRPLEITPHLLCLPSATESAVAFGMGPARNRSKRAGTNISKAAGLRSGLKMGRARGLALC